MKPSAITSGDQAEAGRLSRPRLSVVHIIVGLERGGAERMLERLALDPTAGGLMHQEIVSLGSLGPIGRALRARGVAVHPLGMHSAGTALATLWRLRRLLKQLRPDVVQTWMYHADLLGGLAAWSLNLPVVWGIRTTSLGSGNARLTRYVRRMCAILSAWIPDAIIFVAEAARRSHMAAGYANGIMQVVPNGFEIAARERVAELREAWRREHGLAATDVVIGWVGRFNPDKDVHSFVKAAGVVASTESSVVIVMVGRGLDPGNQELQRWIRAEGHLQRILLLGEQADATACFCGFDMFALSSHTEAFPNVVAEAMAVGLPCVVTDVGDVRLLAGDTAHVVAAGDVPTMARELLRLVRDPAHRAYLGRMALERVTAKFSMAACARQFHKVYQDVLSSRSTR
jgi:glycosyltransferase involved in cell wall biosynthesis